MCPVVPDESETEWQFDALDLRAVVRWLGQEANGAHAGSVRGGSGREDASECCARLTSALDLRQALSGAASLVATQEVGPIRSSLYEY